VNKEVEDALNDAAIQDSLDHVALWTRHGLERCGVVVHTDYKHPAIILQICLHYLVRGDLWADRVTAPLN